MLPIVQFGEPRSRKASASGELQFCCPQCHIRHPEKHQDVNYHLYFNVKKKKFFCHRCGFKGRLDSLHSDFPSVPSWDELTNAIEGLERSPKRSTVPVEHIPNPACEIPLYRGTESPPGFVMEYLTRRGITYEDILRYELSYSPLPWPMIIFKIRMPSLSAWVGRSIFDSAPIRYYNAPGNWRQRAIFNYDKCRGIPVKILEGPFSAVAAGPNGVGTFGINFTEEQVEALCSLESPFYLVSFDGGSKGSLEYTQANSLAKKLFDRGKKVAIARLPSGIDPANLGRGGYLKAIDTETYLYGDLLELELSSETMR